MFGKNPDIDLESFLTSSPTLQRNSKTMMDGGQISPFLDTSTAHPYHLLAIGTQECERDISESLFYSSKEVWEQRLCDHLGDHYQLLRCETMTALHLAVFVWKPVASYVKNIHGAGIKTGWGNMVGNKGAVAVSLDFGSQSLLFINCHLRAHQTKLAERNANVYRILHELQIKGGKSTSMHSPNKLIQMPLMKRFSKSYISTKSTPAEHIDTNSGKDQDSKPMTTAFNKPPNNKRKPSDTETTRGRTKRKNGRKSSSWTAPSKYTQHNVMEQFDHVFIFGDTNYRINAERQFVLNAIQKQDFETLLKHDQLTMERHQCTTPLATFKEHPINFIPTYKFDTMETVNASTHSASSLPIQPVSSPQTTSSSSSSFVITPTNSQHSSGNSISVRYDTSPKQRIPSWTDRILWHDRQIPLKETITPPIPVSEPIMTSKTHHSKIKLNLKWISALTLKHKSNTVDRGIVDKSTVCYHYDTVMDPRLMGASDHLPVIGVYGVWFDDWGSTVLKRTKSIKSANNDNKRIPLWKRW
ncbi:Endonuclease/exonuclease/phosphatase [Chlamydoabsidia padenii]|nr:Endonuclease/exonuclease/phosphatase [Chlamydoabsidia padenii]